jgi:hypothetical protein
MVYDTFVKISSQKRFSNLLDIVCTEARFGRRRDIFFDFPLFEASHTKEDTEDVAG